MASAQAERDKVLREYADGVLAERERDTAEESRRKQAAAAAMARKRENYERTRVAEKERVEGAKKFEAGIRSAMDGLKSMLAANATILLAGASAPGLSQRGALVRCGRWLAGQLQATARTGDFFGNLRLNAGGFSKAGDSFAAAEQRIVESVVLTLDPNTEGTPTNGACSPEPEDSSVTDQT